MATVSKGKTSSVAASSADALSPRVNGNHPSLASSPHSPTSPLLHGHGAAPSTLTSGGAGYPRTGSSSKSSTPSSPMNGLSPTLPSHFQPHQQCQHHHHAQPRQQLQQPPPRFRQQQQNHSSSSNADIQQASYPSPHAYHHTLPPVQSTSTSASPGLASTLPSSTTGTSRSPYITGTSMSGTSSTTGPPNTNNPTIASMQSPHHHHHYQPSSSRQYAQNNQQAGASTSASTSTSPHFSTTSPPTAVLSSAHNATHHPSTHYSAPSARLPRPSETFTRELSNVLQHTFIPSILPSAEEYKIKENARKYLEYLADRITPGAKLLPFGSQANGLALRNSDMDLCYISPPGKPRKPPSELVELLGRMIEVEAPVFAVKMLSRARIPIIKLSPSPIYHLRRQEAELTAQQQAASSSSSAQKAEATGRSIRKVSSASAPASSGPSRPSSASNNNTPTSESREAKAADLTTSTSSSSPKQASSTPPPSNNTLPSPPPMPEYGLSCDIGFENRLALENTRLILTYAMADPRLRTIVLFLKVWTKRRKINNPYLGTLSSYGYVLLVIHFLMNVRKPPVLPNLQRLRPSGVMPLKPTEFEGRDIYFFDDLELLPRYWQSTNRDNIGELLIAFFHYYYKEFRYTFDVVSIRTEGGVLNKVAKGWMNDQLVDIAHDGTAGKDGTNATPGPNRNIPRDLNRLCIEDPFQTDYNVARTVTVDGLFTIRGEIARATSILRGTRSDVNAVIAELLEEREDYLVHAPPPNSNRRRSAPSPRLQPSLLATHQDFRTWALANGVPHAQGGNMPMFPHQLQGTTSLIDEMDGTGQARGVTAINAEALARYQQASQALSQLNLQQQQAQQQQLFANLPSLLSATNLRNTQRGTSRRFHEHSYKQFRQQGNAMHSHQQNAIAQQILSAQQAQQGFSNNAVRSGSLGYYQPAGSSSSRSQTISKTQNASTHLTRPPILERRSSWDGSVVSDETRQQYRRTSALSEAGIGSTSPNVGTTTAPTSPAMHNGQLPAFAGHAVYPPEASGIASPTLSTVSIATAPAGLLNQCATIPEGRPRDFGNKWQTSSSSTYGRSVSHASRDDQRYLNSPGRYDQGTGILTTGTSLPMQAYPTGLPMGRLPFAGGSPMDYTARGADLAAMPMGRVPRATSQSTSLLASPAAGLSTQSLEERDPVVDDGEIPSPSSIRFGNFDAAFYSSEPTDMAGLGLYDARSTSSDGSPLSFSGTPSFDDSNIPEEVELPPPVRLPPQQLATFASSMRAAQRFRPQLADIPASPAAKHVPGPDSTSRRPSLQSNRRRSAGDEAGLGLGDVTFFGKIPVSRNEDEREKAMAALLKESSKDYKPSSLPSSSATSQVDLMHVEKESTSDSVASTAPTNDSSAVSAPRKPLASYPTSANEAAPPSPTGKTLGPSDAVGAQASVRSVPSYAALAASRPTGLRKRTGT